MKLFGHPIHQMLVVFPLGLFATAVVFDVIGLVRAQGYWSGISFWMIAAGIVGGLLAAIFGLLDWLGIPAGTRAKFIGLLHGGGNLVVTLLFIGSWMLRRAAPESLTTTQFLLSFVGVLLALVTGWLGGELVDRLGVGVDAGANLNAPSSLSGLPASGTSIPPEDMHKAA